MSHSSHFKVPSIMELYLDCRLQHNSERLTWQQPWEHPALYFILRNITSRHMDTQDTLELLINWDTFWYLSCTRRRPTGLYIISLKLATAAEMQIRRAMCLLLVAVSLGFTQNMLIQQHKTKGSESEQDKRRWKTQSKRGKKNKTHHHKQQLKMAFKLRKNT